MGKGKIMALPWEQTYESEPPSVGGGRGSINPPMVYEQQPVPTTIGRRGGTNRELRGTYGPGQMAPGYAGSGDGDTALATGLARGVTAGTSVYPEAYIKSIMAGKGYDETLTAVREEDKILQQKHPYLYGGGELAGNIALGATTGGSSIPLQIAAQGGISAMSAYTKDKEASLKDAAIAGAASTVLAGAGTAAFKLGSAVIKKVGEKTTTSNLWNLVNNRTPQAKNELEKLFGQTDAQIQKSNGMDVWKYGELMAKELEESAGNIHPRSPALPGAAGMANQALTADISNLTRNAVGSVIGGGLGATAAGAYNYATDSSIDPLYAAGLGGLSGAGARYAGARYLFMPKTQKGVEMAERFGRVGSAPTVGVLHKNMPVQGQIDEQGPWTKTYE